MNQGIVISSSPIHGRFLPRALARKLEENGIPAMLTSVGWPRDELKFYADGRYDYVQGNTIQHLNMTHFAWNGGTYLQGSDFLLSSANGNPIEKRAATHAVLDVENGYYFDLSSEMDALTHIRISGRGKPLYQSSFSHIDPLYNLTNRIPGLYTYDTPTLIETGEKMSSMTGYPLVRLPTSEAKVLAVGFVEFQDKVILDSRAWKTRRILENIGYDVVATPWGIGKTNRNGGSLRCMTTELPISLDQLMFLHPNEFGGICHAGEYSILSDRHGKRVAPASQGVGFALK